MIAGVESLLQYEADILARFAADMSVARFRV